MEVQIGLSAYKLTSQRQSTTALDMFGDLGGFHQCVDFSVFIFGEWFAAQFFLQSLANSLYLLKKSDREIEEEEKQELEEKGR